jgi:hypothetical protein
MIASRTDVRLTPSDTASSRSAGRREPAGNSPPTPGGYPIITPIIDWKTGTQMESEALEVDPAFLWPGQIWRRVQQFRQGGGFGEIVINLISGRRAV